MLTSTQTYDDAIAGSGPAGSSTAFKLAKNGLNVILIEKSSLATAGIANPVVSTVELIASIFGTIVSIVIPVVAIVLVLLIIFIILRRVYKKHRKPS